MDVSWLSLAPISIHNPKLFTLSLENISKGEHAYSEPSS